jgi:Tol biopolymer transport system component
MTAELFAPGVVSTGMLELNSNFFPGGKEVIFSVGAGPMRWVLVMMREVDGRWTQPEVAPFSGAHGGVDPFVSYDGNTVYFCSNRPRSGSGEPEDDYDIWFVERTEGGWSEPANMGAPINSDAHEFYPSLTRDGTFYVQSRREGGVGGPDIYRAELVDGHYVEAHSLPEPVNSPGFEGDTMIAPDESYLIVSTRREQAIGPGADLYISFRAEDGSWGPLQNLGETVNSATSENCPILSPDGKYLFFTSRRMRSGRGQAVSYEELKEVWTEPGNGQGDVYWVDARVLDQFRPE